MLFKIKIKYHSRNFTLYCLLSTRVKRLLRKKELPGKDWTFSSSFINHSLLDMKMERHMRETFHKKIQCGKMRPKNSFGLSFRPGLLAKIWSVKTTGFTEKELPLTIVRNWFVLTNLFPFCTIHLIIRLLWNLTYFMMLRYPKVFFVSSVVKILLSGEHWEKT